MIFANTDLFLSGLLSGTAAVYAKVISALAIFGLLLFIDNISNIKNPIHMSRLKKFNLISGIFTSEDATEILGHFFSEKIKFHEQRKFGLFERKGVVCEFSENRLKELKKDNAELMETLTHAHLTGKTLKITSHIEVELVDDEPTLQNGKVLEKASA